ncbi:hypothetical protein [Nostoc sp.]|uniref:hypothetical protein n=1 Tax=Nostoc sp. TaxID=1180 RepID=UPI002FF6F6E9
MDEFDNLLPEDAEYLLNLPFHLAEASKEEGEMVDELSVLLTDYEFIEYKTFKRLPQELINDYDLALHSDIQIHQQTKQSLKLIQSAIKLAANVLSDNPILLAGQLWGRLQSFQKPEIQAMLTQAQQQLQEYIWLRPLKSNLTPPEGALLSTLTGHKDWVKAVAITPDGKIAVSGSHDCTLKVWDLYSGIEILTLRGHRAWIQGVAITSDGKIAVSASIDGTLKVWDLRNGTELRTLIGHTSAVSAVTISLDGQLAVSASEDKTLKVWDLHSGNEVCTLIGHTGAVNAVVINPNGQLAVSCACDKTLRVWDLHSGTELRTLKGHTDFVNAVAITPDGKLAVSASSDNTLKVWDINIGTELHTLIGHYYWVWTVAITLDGRFIVSGSWDQTLKVWDLESGEEITTFNCEGELNTCAISPDGVTIVAAGRSNRIHFLRLEGI